MEKNLFREVYKQVCELALKDCPPSSLSGLLHGYLSVYSMVRVYPWLEDEYGSLWDIHDRIREIAQVIQELHDEYLGRWTDIFNSIDYLSIFRLGIRRNCRVWS